MSQVFFDYSISRYRVQWRGRLSPRYFGSRADGMAYLRQCEFLGLLAA